MDWPQQQKRIIHAPKSILINSKKKNIIWSVFACNDSQRFLVYVQNQTSLAKRLKLYKKIYIKLNLVRCWNNTGPNPNSDKQSKPVSAKIFIVCRPIKFCISHWISGICVYFFWFLFTWHFKTFRPKWFATSNKVILVR